MGQHWTSKRSVRLGALVAICFIAGIAISYTAAYRKAQYNQQLYEEQVKAGGRMVRGKDGKVTFQPLGVPGKGTEIPHAAPGEMLDTTVDKTPPADVFSDLVPELKPEAELKAEAEKAAFLRAHSEPAIGLFLPGTFTLVDHNGKGVTEKSWPGQYLLIYFGYTHCPDVCPVTLEKIAKAVDALGPLGKRLQPLFITVDPARDTPEVMKAYVEKLGGGIVGLTGSPDQIKSALDSYRAEAVKSKTPPKTGGGYTVDHSSYVYLMSPSIKVEELFRMQQGTKEIAERLKIYMITAKPFSTAP